MDPNRKSRLEYEGRLRGPVRSFLGFGSGKLQTLAVAPRGPARRGTPHDLRDRSERDPALRADETVTSEERGSRPGSADTGHAAAAFVVRVPAPPRSVGHRGLIAVGVALSVCASASLVGAETWPSLEQWRQALESKRMTLESEKSAFNGDCAIVWSNDHHKVQECRQHEAQIRTAMAAYNKELAAYEKAKTRIDSFQPELDSLNRRLETTRHEVEKYETRVPKYNQALEEWAALPEAARQEARATAIGGVLSVIFDALAAIPHQQAEATLQTIERLTGWKYQRYLSGVERTTANRLAGALQIDVNTLRDRAQTRELISAMNEAMDAQRHVSDHDREEVLTVGLKTIALVNGVWIRDPRIGLLTAGGKIIVADAYVGGAVLKARERLQQLLDLGDDNLNAITALTLRYKFDVDRRHELNREREALLTR